MKRLARHRDFRLLFAGHVTSLFGDLEIASLYLTRAPVLRESVRAAAAARAAAPS